MRYDKERNSAQRRYINKGGTMSKRILVEVDPNPRKIRKHAAIVVHETGLGLRGEIVVANTTVAVEEDPAQLTFVSVLGKQDPK